MVQWMVLETGVSPLTLRGTEDCGENKSRNALYFICKKESCTLGESNYSTDPVSEEEMIITGEKHT